MDKRLLEINSDMSYIPKIIHYCWFGGNPLPPSALDCISSWKKYFPDYEIKEWNETNFDVNAVPFSRDAYALKKYAFVSDYARFQILYESGGIYFDTDVEVVKPLDEFLKHDAFSGFENETQIQTGIMACQKDFPLFQKLLEYYDDISFFNEDGTINYTTNVTIITEMCLKFGLRQDNTFQIVDGFALYPKDYFCPIDYTSLTKVETENTATIHHFAASWFAKEAYKQLKKDRRLYHRIRVKHYILHIPNRILRGIFGGKNYEKLKSKFKS